jgi:hypothetical protein
MYDFVHRNVRSLAGRIDLWRYRAKARLEHFSRAWGYFTDRLTADDAQCIMLDCRDSAGWHPLLVLTVEDTLEQARETFADLPALTEFVARGCARVGDKWEAYGDELYEARRWALDLAEDYASADGVVLVRLDGQADDASEEVAS